MITNLNQFKKAIKTGVQIEVVEHFYHPECTGQIRTVTKVQTNAFYSKPTARCDGPLDARDERWIKANDGKGSYLPYGKADNWKFCNGIIQYVSNFQTYDKNGNLVTKTQPVATYRLIKEN